MSSSSMIILTPVYNDWLSLTSLLREIDGRVDNKAIAVRVVAIDDGSTESCAPVKSQLATLKHIQQVDVLHLARNLGHQKAISIGLAYINTNMTCDFVIVMDSDGEDQPADITRLIEAHAINSDHIIFARRARRSEGLVFRLFYFFYRIIFRLLTGKEIAFGNFCLIPFVLLHRVVYLPEIWNHFAAGIMRANLPRESIPTQRGKRYAGQSSMNFVGLVVHGLSAISVYIEILTVRLMLASGLIISAGVIGFFVLLYVRYLTPLAIPGWATNVAIGIVVITLQAVLFLTLLTFLVLNYRSAKLFIPAKDFQDYFINLERLY